MIRRGGAAKRHADRRAWLEARPEMTVGVPGINDDVTDVGRAALDRLHAALNKAGHFARTGHAAQRETVRRLVSELRGEHIGGGGW